MKCVDSKLNNKSSCYDCSIERSQDRTLSGIESQFIPDSQKDLNFFEPNLTENVRVYNFVWEGIGLHGSILKSNRFPRCGSRVKLHEMRRLRFCLRRFVIVYLSLDLMGMTCVSLHTRVSEVCLSLHGNNGVVTS